MFSDSYTLKSKAPCPRLALPFNSTPRNTIDEFKMALNFHDATVKNFGLVQE